MIDSSLYTGRLRACSVGGIPRGPALNVTGIVLHELECSVYIL